MIDGYQMTIMKRLILMIERGELKPTVYHKHYRGFESVVDAMHDLAARHIWGKAIIDLEFDSRYSTKI